MAGKTYSEKLRDPRWQKKRLKIMERDNFSCINCGARDKTLEIHHCYYCTGMDPWDYHPNSLQTLCSGCHDEAEEARFLVSVILFQSLPKDLQALASTLSFINQHDGDKELRSLFVSEAVNAHWESLKDESTEDMIRDFKGEVWRDRP